MLLWCLLAVSGFLLNVGVSPSWFKSHSLQVKIQKNFCLKPVTISSVPNLNHGNRFLIFFKCLWLKSFYGVDLKNEIWSWVKPQTIVNLLNFALTSDCREVDTLIFQWDAYLMRHCRGAFKYFNLKRVRREPVLPNQSKKISFHVSCFSEEI